MPYQVSRHAADMLWIVMHGTVTMDQAEQYFYDVWQMLDNCDQTTDLLVDGRGIAHAEHAARRRTEQIAHHPNLGHIAFVVREQHMLMFAPFVRLVSGIGLFGSESEALDYLRASRGLPPVIDLDLPTIPPPRAHSHATYHTSPARPVVSPATRTLHGLTDIVDTWSRGLRAFTEH